MTTARCLSLKNHDIYRSLWGSRIFLYALLFLCTHQLMDSQPVHHQQEDMPAPLLSQPSFPSSGSNLYNIYRSVWPASPMKPKHISVCGSARATRTGSLALPGLMAARGPVSLSLKGGTTPAILILPACHGQ